MYDASFLASFSITTSLPVMVSERDEERRSTNAESPNGIVKKIDDAAEAVKKEVHFRRHESLHGVDLLWLLVSAVLPFTRA